MKDFSSCSATRKILHLYVALLAPFQYLAPNTLERASELLVSLGPRARVYAGGTALLLALERRLASADALVNLKRIRGLDALDFDPARGLAVGALVTLDELMRSQAVLTHYPVLVETARSVATPQVRNLATVVGNVCTAAPSADLAVTLLALDAVAHIFSVRGERAVPLAEFFPTWGGNVLVPGEIVTRIEVPLTFQHATYQRFMVREAVDVPLANVATGVRFENDHIADVRIVLGANGPRPTRMVRAEYAFARSKLDDQTVADAVEWVAADAYLADDSRASRWYRQEVVRGLVRRALESLLTDHRDRQIHSAADQGKKSVETDS